MVSVMLQDLSTLFTRYMKMHMQYIVLYLEISEVSIWMKAILESQQKDNTLNSCLFIMADY